MIIRGYSSKKRGETIRCLMEVIYKIQKIDTLATVMLEDCKEEYEKAVIVDNKLKEIKELVQDDISDLTYTRLPFKNLFGEVMNHYLKGNDRVKLLRQIQKELRECELIENSLSKNHLNQELWLKAHNLSYSLSDNKLYLNFNDFQNELKTILERTEDMESYMKEYYSLNIKRRF